MEAVITGTGHCGTGWMAQLMTTLGFETGHELVFDCHGHHTEYEADVFAEASCAAPAWSLRSYRVLHLVRSLTGFAEGMYGRYFWSDDCPHPDHAPGDHLRSPYAQFFDVHTSREILSQPTEWERIQANWRLWNRKIGGHHATRYAGYVVLNVEAMWHSVQLTRGAVEFLTMTPHTYRQIAVAMTEVGTVNTHPHGWEGER